MKASDIDRIFNITESFQLPQRVLDILFSDDKERIFDDLIGLGEDLGHDWFTEYFEEKIRCHNRRLYSYDKEKAEEELKKEFEEEGSFVDDNYCDTWEEAVECKIRDILWDFDDNSGLGPEGYEALDKMDPDAWEYASNLGKERTGIIELYLLAFRLAQEDLKRQEKEV